MNELRSFVRPFLTITGWLTVLLLVATTDGDIRVFFLGSLTMMIGYWFGERKK